MSARMPPPNWIRLTDESDGYVCTLGLGCMIGREEILVIDGILVRCLDPPVVRTVRPDKIGRSVVDGDVHPEWARI